jgi:hypothetical protein
MKFRSLIAGSLLALAVSASAAHASIYVLTFTGQDFGDNPITISYSTPIGPGHQGYSGGPDQTWNEETNSANYSGWLDFFLDGKTLIFEGASPTLYLQSATAFYDLTSAPGPSTPFSLSFPDVSVGHPDIVSLTNDGYLAPGAGNFDTLTITAVPEPAAWALMIFGIAGVGGALRLAKRKGETALAAA